MNVHERVEEVYLAERNNIYAYILYCGVPMEQARDLTQEAFLKLYLKMADGDEIENPRAWVYRVAHNFALRYREREPHFAEIDRNAATGASNPEMDLLERERRAALAKAIGGLSPQQRNCLHLRVRGLRYREIAETIGISVSAVGEFLHRAVTHLKEALDA
jgi:RNA polymerase sigma-70 factor, ECF subfamily